MTGTFLEDRLRGCLYGLAVGDALGAAVEFREPGSFPPVTGFRAGGPHGLEAGEWTDDTSMALALADSIATTGWDLDDQAERYLAWMRTGKYSVTGALFDIGSQTAAALRRFERSRDARASASAGESASGNGSIMRLAPAAIAHARCFPDRLELLLDRAEESSIPTHASPLCRSACRLLALYLAALAHGLPREEVLDPRWPLRKRAGPLHPAVERIAHGRYREKRPPEIRGGGYVVESLEAALWSFHDASSFREAVVRAVNLGHDADTTGAVCGQLAGACWGERGIPEEWREGLARRELIEAALRPLLDLAEPPAARRRGPGGAAAEPPEWSFWVLPGRLLAGCYPGSQDPEERDGKLERLLDVGIRAFFDLTEADERHWTGPLEPYAGRAAELARRRGTEIDYFRFPVRDGSVPSAAEMTALLAALEEALRRGPAYLHCLGGVGRTGTAAACLLLSRGEATGADVLARLAELRRMDRERGSRPAPERAEQVRFVQEWARRRPGPPP